MLASYCRFKEFLFNHTHSIVNKMNVPQVQDNIIYLHVLGCLV